MALVERNGSIGSEQPDERCRGRGTRYMIQQPTQQRCPDSRTLVGGQHREILDVEVLDAVPDQATHANGLVAVKGDHTDQGSVQRRGHGVPVEGIGPADCFRESAVLGRCGQTVEEGTGIDHLADGGTTALGAARELPRSAERLWAGAAMGRVITAP